MYLVVRKVKIHLGKVCTQSLESEDLLWKSEGSLAKGVVLNR